jgi:addiction module HigA family antidote
LTVTGVRRLSGDQESGVANEIILRGDLPGMNFSADATGEKLPAVTPGEILRDEFMEPLGLSGRALAAEPGIPANRVTDIVAGRRAITAETALLLAERFGGTAEFWLGLQMAFDLEQARRARAA